MQACARLLLAALLACMLSCRKNPADQACAAMRDRLVACTPDSSGFVASAGDDLYDKCRITLRTEREPGAAPISYEKFFDECTPMTTCSALTACTSTHGCTFILTAPEDRTPELFCRL